MNQRKDPKAASKKFEEVDRQHPYSDWARKSLLMSGGVRLSAMVASRLRRAHWFARADGRGIW